MKKPDLSQWNSWAGRTSQLTWILALLQLLHTSYWVSVKATCNLKILICDVSLPASSYFKDRNCYTDDILFPFLKKLLVVDHFFFFGNSKNISKPYTYCKYIYIYNNLIVKGYVTSNSPPRYWSMNLLLGLAPSWNMIINLNKNVDLFNNNGDFLNQMLSSKAPLFKWLFI